MKLHLPQNISLMTFLLEIVSARANNIGNVHRAKNIWFIDITQAAN
jgi:hypothetical protein